MKKIAMLIAVSSMALAGCTTHLEVKQQAGLATKPAGIPYRLPETHIDLTATWTLTRCPVLFQGIKDGKLITLDENGKALALLDGMLVDASVAGSKPLTEASLRLGKFYDPIFSVVATHELRTSQGEELWIDYEDLTKGFKTGSIKAEYHEGGQVLKSINAEVKGLEAEALKSTVSIVGGIARIALGVPSVGAGEAKGAVSTRDFDEGYKEFTKCTDEVRKHLETRSKLVEQLTRITKENERANEELTELSATRVLRDLTDREKEQLDKIATLVKTSEKEIKSIKPILAKFDAKLSMSVKFPVFERTPVNGVWTVSPKEQDFERVVKFAIKEEQSVRARPVSPPQTRTGPRPQSVRKAGLTPEKIALSATLSPRESGETCASSVETDNACKLNGNERGLIFRTPVAAQLVVKNPNESDDKKAKLLEATVNVPQLGRYSVLPLTNGWGENNAISAQFDKDGRPTSIEYKKLKSGGNEALGVFQAATDSALSFQSDIAAKAQADLKAADDEEAAELTRLQRERDILKARAEIETLTADTPAEIEALNAEIARATLEASLAELQQRIRNAQPEGE